MIPLIMIFFLSLSKKITNRNAIVLGLATVIGICKFASVCFECGVHSTVHTYAWQNNYMNTYEYFHCQSDADIFPAGNVVKTFGG